MKNPYAFRMMPRTVMFVIMRRPGVLVRIVLEFTRPERSPADGLMDATSNDGSGSCEGGVCAVRRAAVLAKRVPVRTTAINTLIKRIISLAG